MVVNVKLKNSAATATVTRGKFARVSSVTATKNKSKTKSLARVVAPASSEIKNGSEGVHHGGRIHAQRKFAQGANVSSPAATPVKSRNDEGRLRKRVISPTPFPISKRPKTEDFLSFLCYRGTSVMPPDLDFFNYSALDKDKKDVKSLIMPNGNKAPNENTASHSTNGAHNSSSSKKDVFQTPDKAKANHESKKEESKGKATTKYVNGSFSKSKAESKSSIGKLDKINTNVVSKVMSALVKKDNKRNAEKTTTARLNEQDARFAMTALKLKYQEKRLAQSKSTISKITKKVKERSVILTRSKAKSEKSPSKSPTLLKQKVLKKNASSEAKKVQSRNVPSPDIIYGVTHNKSKIAECSESEKSSSSSSSSSSDSSSSNSSDSEESEDEQPVVKSLRSGNKEFVVKPNRVKPTIRKIPIIRRMGTRAMHRTSKSPLRELPMYSLKKFKRKKIIRKIDQKGKNLKFKQSIKSKQENVKNKVTEKQKGKADNDKNGKSKEKDSVSKAKEKLKEKTKPNEVSKTNNKISISNKDKSSKLESKNAKKLPSRIETNSKKPTKKEESESESESESEETLSSDDDNKSSKSKSEKASNQKTNIKSNAKSPKGIVRKTSISKPDNSSKKKITRKNEESDEEPIKKASNKVIAKTKPEKPDQKTNTTKSNQANKKEIKSKSESSNSKSVKKPTDEKVVSKKGNVKSQNDTEKKNVKSKPEVNSKKKPTKNAPNKETDESSDSEKSDSESEEESDEAKTPPKPNKSPKKERESILSDSFGRPMRKTREAAEIYMGLLNKDFSSDEDVMSDKNVDPNSDESGSTSSSETKFLEKQYNASLKRIEQQGKTTKVQTKSNKLKNAAPKGKTASTKKPLGRPPNKTKSPEKRILRSQRTHSEDIPPQSSLAKQRKSTSPNLVTRRRISLPLASCDRRKEGAVRKSASICPRRPADFSYSSSGSDHDTSSSEHSSSTSDSDEQALAKNTEEIKRRSLEIKRKGTAQTKSRDTSDSEEDSSSEEESQPAKVIASLSKPRALAVKRRASTTSVGEDSKNIATEMRRLVEQKRAVEAGTVIEEKPEQDTEMEMEIETDHAERSFSADDEQESTSESSRASSSPSSSSGSESEDETPAKPPVEKSSIAIQVDLDLEDIEAAAAAAAAAAASAATQTAARITEISATVTHMTHAETSTSTHTHTHTTQHSHIDLGLGYVPSPEMPLIPPPPPPPFIPSYPRPDFYQSLHLAPPMVSSIQMVGQGSQDFVSTHHLGIPVSMSMPLHPSLVPLAPRVMAPNPLCFSTTSITTAATLQTHIRSVAANLDIPLVRPIVGADSPLNVPLPLPRGPHCHIPSASTPMTRPINFWSNDGRSHHYSAFRVPLPAGKIIQQQSIPLPPPPISCPNTMGSVLPLSIVQPQHPAVSGSSQMHHHQNFQHQQQQRLPANARSVQHTAPNSLRPINCPSSSAQSHGYSILQNLPNVSIVPRFDRNSKTVVLPSQIASSSSQAKDSRKDKIKKEKPEGKKRKKIIMPQPPSPLLFNKNSANPATYVKKNSKSHSKEKESAAETSRESKSDPFNKLLQMKKECTSEGEQTVPIQRPSTSTPEKIHHIKRASSKDKSGDDLPPTNKKPEKAIVTSSTGTGGDSVDVSTDDAKTCNTKEMKMQEVPSFYPDEDDFQDPLKYIEQIREKAERFGMVKIVPPRSFRPECNVEDDMRFTAYNHYIHKMFKRWGPNVHETAAIKEHLRNTDVDMSTPPLLGGMEVDLSTLYHTVQSFGGLKEVIEKQKWHKVSDAMHFPKAANDRATKLDAIYVKYVLPFEMLSENERKKLMSSVDSQWIKRQDKQLDKDADEESDAESDEDHLQEFDDCVVKGKSTPLSSYYRVARNTFSMLFQGKDQSCSEIESEYWKMVREGSRHLCVYSGSIDCAGVGWGFPLPKAGAKHPWNLKVLANSQGSALRSMGPVMGATVPTLHVAMIFTTYCWYRDPHSLPWIEYLHSGANKIWYSIPGKYEDEFRKALKELMPLQCKSKKLWLASDSAMVPPEMLLSKGVSVARAVQKPGEFLVVFPKTFTSAICTGYLVSESVCFAPPAWLSSCIKVFKDIRESKEPPVFGLEKLLISILTDNRASSEVLQMALPLVELILKDEFGLRKKLLGMGLGTGQMGPSSDKVSKKKTKREEEHVHQCDVCNYILHLSIVTNKTREFDLCLPHAIQHFHKTKSHIKGSLLLFDHTDEDLENIVQGAKNRLEKRSS